MALSRFGVWHAAVWSLALAAAALVVGWAWASNSAQAHQPWAWSIAALLAAMALGLAYSLGTVAPFSLDWDGERWLLRRSHASPSQAQSGDLTVAFDLGAWMLLRFAADAPGHPATRWLPVQRAGLEAQWHALRCAVYARRAEAASGIDH